MGNNIAGFALIMVGLILFIMATPTLQSSVDTGTGKALENESATVKNIYSVYAIFIPLLGIFFFMAGTGILWKG